MMMTMNMTTMTKKNDDDKPNNNNNNNNNEDIQIYTINMRSIIKFVFMKFNWNLIKIFNSIMHYEPYLCVYAKRIYLTILIDNS